MYTCIFITYITLFILFFLCYIERKNKQKEMDNSCKWVNSCGKNKVRFTQNKPSAAYTPVCGVFFSKIYCTTLSSTSILNKRQSGPGEKREKKEKGKILHFILLTFNFSSSSSSSSSSLMRVYGAPHYLCYSVIKKDQEKSGKKKEK